MVYVLANVRIACMSRRTTNGRAEPCPEDILGMFYNILDHKYTCHYYVHNLIIRNNIALKTNQITDSIICK